jgi:hypothetical protein
LTALYKKVNLLVQGKQGRKRQEKGIVQGRTRHT